MCYADHTITLTTDERADHIILPIFFYLCKLLGGRVIFVRRRIERLPPSAVAFYVTIIICQQCPNPHNSYIQSKSFCWLLNIPLKKIRLQLFFFGYG